MTGFFDEPVESDLEVTSSRFTPPPVQGTPVTPTERTYGKRQWPEQHVTWTEPEVPEPVLKATRCSLDVFKTRVRIVYPPVPDGHVPAQPAGALQALRLLLAIPDAELLVTYARGYDIAMTGEPTRSPLWEEREPTPEDRRKRVQIGHRPPAPVDSLLIRGRWPTPPGLVLVSGAWIDAKPMQFLTWTAKHGVYVLSWTDWKALLDSESVSTKV
jgi:hypothetical protein